MTFTASLKANNPNSVVEKSQYKWGRRMESWHAWKRYVLQGRDGRSH